MAVRYECGICFQSYNENDRRPLVLPCSHSFCQSCLEKLEATGTSFCSLCRKSWGHMKVKDFLCCYQLICSMECNQPKNTQKCSDHEEDVTMWCESCSLGICVKCLRLTHKECDWVLIEEHNERHQATYNEAASGLVEMISKNSVTLSSLDNLMHNVLSCRDELMAWQNNAEEQLANYSLKPGQFKPQAVALQQNYNTLHKMRQFSPSNNSSSMLFLISMAFEESNNGELETFMTKLRTIPDPFLVSKVDEKTETFKQRNPQAQSASPKVDSENGSARTANHNNLFSIKSAADLQHNAAVSASQNKPTFQDGTLWIIKDNASLSAANMAMRSTLVTPSHVKIEGLHLNKRQMSDFIALVSKTHCILSLRVLDTFWRPSPRNMSSGSYSRSLPSMTILTTRSTLFSLAKPAARCTVAEYWGHLDEDCIKKLPTTCRSVGLALVDKEDMASVNMLVEADAGKWVSKNEWSSLEEINLSVARSFSASYWKLQKRSRGFFSSSASISRLSSVSLTFGLHFPNLEAEWSDVTWLKEILQKIAAQISYEGILRDVYLPDSQITPASLQSVITTFGLTVFTNISPVTVHFASSRLDPNSNSSYTIGKCLFNWDIGNNSDRFANIRN